MVIKKSKYYLLHLIPFVLFFGITTIFFIHFDIPLSIKFLTIAPIDWLLISDLISVWRTFIIDEEGCTVCFWKYRKRYTWKQLKTKRIEHHDIPSRYSGILYPSYLTEVVLSPYRIHKPKFIRAAFYSMLHPFSCIYFNFALDGNADDKFGYYEVEEETFLQRMKEWGVELEEIVPWDDLKT